MKRHGFLRIFWLLGLTITVVSVIGAGMALNSGLGQSTPDDPKPAASTTPPKGRGQAVAFGHVDVDPGVAALSPSQPGRIVKIFAEENKEVEAGAPLLQLDDRTLKLAVRQAEVVLLEARKRLEEVRKLPEQHKLKIEAAKSALKAAEARIAAAQHTRDLLRERVGSNLANAKEANAATELVKEQEATRQAETEKIRELELIDPNLAVERSQADVELREAQLESAKVNLDECTLRAPAKGTVLRVLVSPGDYFTGQAKAPALWFCPDQKPIVRAEVEQEEAAGLKPGMRVLIDDDSRNGLQWNGEIERISRWFTHRRSILLDPLTQNDVRTLECIVKVTNPTDELRIGQRVRVTISKQAP